MLDHAAVRGFILERPRAHTLRLTGDDQEVVEILATHKTAAALAQTCVAKDPALIECLDDKGGLVRAKRAADLSLAPPKKAMASASEPVIAEALKGDPQAAMLSHFAALLHRAYEHATETAFSHLVAIVERMEIANASRDARLERVEAAYRREQQARIEDLWDHAEERAEQGDAKEQMMSALAQGMFAGAQQPPNGKGKGRRE
jgi:hypothetical protein